MTHYIKEKKHFIYLSYFLLILALFIFNKIIFTFITINIGQTDGNYIYPLDDTYIHLAMAKNLAFYGNWGVVYNEFCSTSSSPIFTLITSLCIKIFGNSTLYPLLINLLFANLIILILFLNFRKNPIIFIFCVLFLLCPVLLHVQVLNGMEHTMHIFLILSITILLIKLINSNFNNKKYRYCLLIIIGLLCLTRYESMFFITAIIFIILLFKQYKLAFIIFCMGFLPIVLFGLYSIINGGYFFPNSLLIKGNINVYNGFISLIYNYLGRIYLNLKTPLFCVPILLISILIFIDFIKTKEYNFQGLLSFIKKYYLVFITFSTILMHSMFASFGWLFRYEAYLYALLYFTLIIISENVKYLIQINNKKTVSFITCTAILFFIFILKGNVSRRCDESKETMIIGGKNIYDQQIQMSRFLYMYYNKPKVLANDIGAIAYFNQVKLLDIVGLGSNSILKIKREKKISTSFTSNQINQYQFLSEPPYNEYSIIIIYDSWFNIESKNDYEQLNWIKTGELKIPNNLICGSDKVSFYSNNEEDAQEMRKNLTLFKDEVPKDVVITVFQ